MTLLMMLIAAACANQPERLHGRWRGGEQGRGAREEAAVSGSYSKFWEGLGRFGEESGLVESEGCGAGA